MDRNPSHLYPAFRSKVDLVLDDIATYAKVHMPGYTWEIQEGFRTAAYQRSLYDKGRSKAGDIVTQLDGYKKQSNHQTSLAVDIVPRKASGAWTWDIDDKHWQYLGHLARKHGLAWGGDWRKFKDRPHLEWPKTKLGVPDYITRAKAKAWQKTMGLR